VTSTSEETNTALSKKFKIQLRIFSFYNVLFFIFNVRSAQQEQGQIVGTQKLQSQRGEHPHLGLIVTNPRYYVL
jgi:hypothetical protein